MLSLLLYSGGSSASAPPAPPVDRDLGVRNRYKVRPSYDHENKIVNEYLDRLEAAKKTAAQMRAKAASAAVPADGQVREGGDETALGSAVQAAAADRAARKRAIALRDDEFLMFNH